MSVPAEPRPDTDHASAPSGHSGGDDTVAATIRAVGPPTGFSAPAAVGEVGTLGPYRIVKELGQGGMGAVYAALDTRLERRLALKVMLPALAAGAGARERFLREARTAARIKHDNVVTVYEADERNGVTYIAMEFLEGYPLDAYLAQKGLLTIPQVIRIAAETAAGLAAAHKIGLVHRDIKPANLWLEAPNGRVKVLDFGLAKPVSAEVELTRIGAVVGTPAYMSPEQARGQKVDHRSDLFSLGAVLYRLCTGNLPFNGPNTMAVLMALGTEEPAPVRELNPDVPEALGALVHQLLAKRADDRPQSTAEVLNRLRALAEELTAPRLKAAELSTSQPQLVQPQVVYVPIQVTAAPEQNPFADLESSGTGTASSDPSGSPAPAPVRARSGGRWLWPTVGLAALVALALGGLVLVLKNEDRTQAKSEGPDGPTVPGKDGKALAPVGPGTKDPPAADADRKAAERVFSLGGAVRIRINGEERECKTAGDLPKEQFALIGVDLSRLAVTDADLAHFKDFKGLTRLNLNNTKVTDVGLAHFKGCKALVYLYLGNTVVTDAGLAHFKDCKALVGLALSSTAVTDTGLAHFKDCKGLIQLNLTNTQVTDAGLAHFKGCKALTHLYLYNTAVTDAGLEHFSDCKRLALLIVQNTKVTAKGLEAFHAAVPACKIQHDGGVIEPKK
jgi:serine/threonine protein kinase/uncharacterized membrane protein